MFPGPDVLAAFAVVALALTVTPGVDTAITLRSALGGRTGRTVGVVLGIMTGLLVWGALAAVGVSALLAASDVAHTALRLAGAAFLLWTGLRLLWSAYRGPRPTAPAEASQDPLSQNGSEGVVAGHGLGAGWRQGVLTNVLNPKVGAVYVALLPQFIPPDAPQLLWGLELALIHVVLAGLWLGLLAVVAARARRRLTGSAVHRWLDAVAGVVVTGFGVRLAVSA